MFDCPFRFLFAPHLALLMVFVFVLDIAQRGR